jgi:hypothetical protein
MIDEEKHRLTERLVWPMLAVMAPALSFIILLVWGIRTSSLLALPLLTICVALMALAFRLPRKWRGEAAAYVPVQKPERMRPEEQSDIPLREYREAVSRSMLWYPE